MQAWIFGLSILLLSGASVLALESVTVRAVGPVSQEDLEDLDEKLKAASQSNTALEQEDNNPQDLLATALSDYERMVSVMYSEGYFGPSVSVKVDGREAYDIDPFAPPSDINSIDIVVDTGPQFRFGTAKVAPRPEKAEADPIVPGFAKGETANASLVGSAANQGVQEWRNEGHAKADIRDQSIVADHNKKRLNVDVELEPGPRLRFGNLSIEGKSAVREERIREILGYPQGEIYSPDELRQALTRLRRTGVFSVVALTEAETPRPDGKLDFTLALIDQKPRRFGFSGEIASLDGITLSAFWLHRNLWGGAERLRIDGSVSNIGGENGTIGGDNLGNSGGIDYAAGIRLTNPAMFGADNDGFAFGSFESIDDPEYAETSATIGVGLSKYFDDKYYAEVAGGLRYSDVDDAFGHREFYHVVFPSRLEWENRDVPGNTKVGSYANALLTPYIGVKDSESGAMLDLDLRGYLGFGEKKSVVLAQRVQIGSVVGSSLSETPPEYLFFSGGGDTVRGQPYQSLGVDVGASQQSGGRSFYGFSTEVRTDVTDTIGVVGFVDIGYIGPDSYYTSDGNWQSGLGFGLRYATPIGPIRVDLATPYTGESKEFSRVDLYIGIGQAF